MSASSRRALRRRLLALAALAGAGCTGIVRERLPPPSGGQGGKGITFYYENPTASTVWLAGEFNGWTAQAGARKLIPFRQRDDLVWEVTVPYRENVKDPEFDSLDDDVYVEHGRRYQYKLVVDQNNWILDPANRSQVTDPAGFVNSVIVVP